MNYNPITRPYSGDAHRAMSDQREAYFAQSAMTRNGDVAEFALAAATESKSAGSTPARWQRAR